MELVMAKIGDIILDENNPRKTSGLTEESIDSLAESIATAGLKQPPLGSYVKKGGKIHLEVGHRRVLACRKLGWKNIPIIISPVKNKGLRFLGQLTENSSRENLSPMEEIHAFVKAKGMGIPLDIVGKAIGKSTTYLELLLPIAKLPDNYKEKVDTGELQKEIALLMAEKIQPKDLDEAWGWIKKGKSVTGRKAKIEAFLEEKQAGPQKVEAADETLNLALKISNRIFKAANAYKDAAVNGVDVASIRRSNLVALEEEVRALNEVAKSLTDGLRLFKAKKKGKEV